ncbi:MAG: NAD(P)-dependent oxidoreductase [Hyphomicrobiaceae bacterium]
MSKVIGIVGLGVLGEAIAANMVKRDWQVFGFDISTEACERGRRTGVIVSETLCELAQTAPTIITCLATGDALLDVLTGNQPGRDALARNGSLRNRSIEETGLLYQQGQLNTIIEVSTLSVSDKLVAQSHCESDGIAILDCPVSGNRAMALRNELTAFCSGSPRDFEHVKEVLNGFCRTVKFVGEYGNGTKTKLAGNILNLVHNAVAAEVLVLAMKSGLDAEIFHSAISGSASSSAMFEARGRLMVADDYNADGQNFSIPMKDARTIISHAAAYDCPTPIYQAALQLYYAAVANGLESLDPAAVCRVAEKAANYSRKKN